MKKMLRESQCSSTDGDTQYCTLDEFETSETVTYKGITLDIKKNSVYQRITAETFDLISKLKKEIRQYIPTESMKTFQVFDPKLFPTDPFDQLGYGSDEVTSLAVLYNLPEEETNEEWRTLLPTLVTHNDWCTHKSDIISFWRAFLNDSKLKFGKNIRKLIQNVLATPVGSVFKELSFAKFLNHKTAILHTSAFILLLPVARGRRNLECRLY